MRLLTGTSGFAYKEWKGSFYPEDLPASAMLHYYAEHFPSVEINNTFYRMPTEQMLRQWTDEVPAGFTFVLKAPRHVTLRKQPNKAVDAVAQFFRTASVLGDRFGPTLVQLPPNVKKDVARLESFLALVPADARVAFEFRHESWFDDDVFDALVASGAALCIADSEDRQTPFRATTSWGYLRLRRVAYDETDLSAWVARVHDTAWTDAFVFFKHEDAGTGPRLANRFAQLFEAGEQRGTPP